LEARFPVLSAKAAGMMNVKASDVGPNKKILPEKALFEELFDVEEIQKIQDAFSMATGVAAIITYPDGTPITKPSSFCSLCMAIRRTEAGLANCMKSDAILGRPREDGPTIRRCLSGGLMDAGASIVVHGNHVGNWLIGQVLDEDASVENLIGYAEKIGMDRDEFARELSQVPKMSMERFENISRFLFISARNFSEYAMRKLELEQEIGRERLQESVIKKLNDRLMCDINERKTAEQALRQSEERFRYIFEEAPMGIGVFNLMSHKTLRVNEQYAAIVGRTRSEMLQTDWVDITHPDDVEKDNKDTQFLLDNPGKGLKRYKRYIRPDGTIVWAKLTVVGLRSAGGTDTMEITMVEDITEQRQREERILYLNYHDVMTGLHNRAFIEEERVRIEESGDFPLSVIIGDINGLKLINDAFGHHAGDKLLVEIADILKSCCRESDVVARIGGDEFLILLPRTDQEAARAICNKISEACESIAADNDAELFFPSIALGSATKAGGDISFGKIVRNAEDTMYRRKLLDRKSMHSSLIASIKATMFEKSHETEAHAARLVKLSRLVGMELNLSSNELNTLALLATLHDIGKVSVDDAILKKTDRLTEEEWDEIKKHPEAGYRIAQASPELNEIAEYILCHHEHWNGKGYPQGLRGEEIPLLSRIISVVDAYDAMTEDRVYRKAMSKERAIAEIRKNAGIQFDPVIAGIFIDKVLPANGTNGCADTSILSELTEI